MTVVSRWLLTKLSRRRLSPVWHGSVSCSRSSNRTGGFPASGSRKRHTMLRVTPSTASEHNSGVAGLIVNPQVLRCFLRPSLTKAPSLHQRYPASSVLRTFPPPHTAQPDSRELPVDRVCHHRWGFPCCCWSTLPACRRHYPGRSDGPRSLVLSHQRRPSRLHGGLAPALIVSRPAQRSLTLRPACSPSHLSDPLHRRLRRLRFLHRRSDCFRVERTQFPGGTFTRSRPAPFHGARVIEIFHQLSSELRQYIGLGACSKTYRWTRR